MSTQISTADAVKPTWTEAEIETTLRAEKERISTEIRRYPHPIPACDAQFNYLIEQRDQIKQELSNLHEISNSGGIDIVDLKKFIASSVILNNNAKR